MWISERGGDIPVMADCENPRKESTRRKGKQEKQKHVTLVRCRNRPALNVALKSPHKTARKQLFAVLYGPDIHWARPRFATYQLGVIYRYGSG